MSVRTAAQSAIQITHSTGSVPSSSRPPTSRSANNAIAHPLDPSANGVICLGDANEGSNIVEKRSSVRPEQTSVKVAIPTLFSRIMNHRWFVWIPAKLTWGHMKPVIRCATAVSRNQKVASFADSNKAWLGLLVQLILPSERAMGYAACLLLTI